MPLVRDELLRLYRLLRLTRTIEDRTRALYYERRIVGGVYTGTGMEGTTVGAAHALRPGDVLVPVHRDLGAHLVSGMTAREVFCQWLGRGNAPARGRAGQRHMGELRASRGVPTPT